MRDYFSSIGNVVSVGVWHTPSTVRVTFDDARTVQRCVALLHGSRPPGSDTALDVRPGARECTRCAELERELEAERAARGRPVQRSVQQSAARIARDPPPRRRDESDSEDRQQPKRMRNSDFVEAVRTKLGERAAFHVTDRLPPHVQTMVCVH